MRITRRTRRVRHTKNIFISTLLISVIFVVIVSAVIGFHHFGWKGADRQVIKIGYSMYPYPPLHYYNADGELIGFDIDLAREAAILMDTEIQFVPINWSDNLELLEVGDVDLLWGGLERASLDDSIVKFTKSYLRSDIVLLMSEDRDYA